MVNVISCNRYCFYKKIANDHYRIREEKKKLPEKIVLGLVLDTVYQGYCIPPKFLSNNMTTTLIAPTEENASLAQAAEKVANLIESFIELGILVHDNQGTPQSNLALSNKLQTLATQLKAVSNSEDLQDKLIPVDVVSYIEDGRNPDIYTREFVEVTAKLNAKLKGKMEGFKKLGNILSDKLVQEYPRLGLGIDDVKSRTKDEI